MENLQKIVQWLQEKKEELDKDNPHCKIEINLCGKSLKKSFTEFDNSDSDC